MILNLSLIIVAIQYNPSHYYILARPTLPDAKKKIIKSYLN